MYCYYFVDAAAETNEGLLQDKGLRLLRVQKKIAPLRVDSSDNFD